MNDNGKKENLDFATVSNGFTTHLSNLFIFIINNVLHDEKIPVLTFWTPKRHRNYNIRFVPFPSTLLNFPPNIIDKL